MTTHPVRRSDLTAIPPVAVWHPTVGQPCSIPGADGHRLAALVTELDAARGLVRVRVAGQVGVWLPAGVLEELR
jgi:hypothetical protein